ncbi:AsmA family protein [uncultured Roseobacter sp.]|uniref:AsmA family protein n=1 Tax=uncultured Roseobacter sp. TaxID=114847 RepID=UPI002631ABDC|nr:AsmA family protein [uncultured Roseobacter sp.]
MKWILRLVGLVVVLLVVAVVSILFLPADRIARIAAEQLRTATGRDVSITGDVALTFWPVLGARVGGLELGNAEWAEQGPMLQAANTAIGVDAMALLKGDIRITNIEAESPTVRLEQRADGRASWQFSDASGEVQVQTETAPAPAAPARTISIEKVKITDATLIYDAEGSDLISYEGVDLALDWPDVLGPAEIAASLQPAGSEVAVEAVIDGFAGFITGQTQTLRAGVNADAGALSFDGKASTAGAVAGALSLKTSSTDGFLRALGLSGADLPENLGRSIDMTTALTLTPDRKLALRDLIVDLGGNKISGAADIALNGVPQINAQLNVGDFVLSSESPAASGGSGSGGGGSSAGTPSSGWPKTQIDASGLAAFNGEIALSASSIDLGQFKLGATQALLRNDRSRMVFELRDVQAYGGNVAGEFVINNRSGLSVGGGLTAAGIQMQPLLTDAADLDRLTGQGDARLTFLGSGTSVDAIMRSLSGDGSLNIGRGTILGIDLDRLMRSGDTGGGTTVFDSLNGTWTIASGVLSNNDLLLQLKNYQASGAGVVGLGTQTVDYTATPVALRANSGQGVSIPVRFTGPWSNISIRPDFEAVIDAEVDAKVDELENKAKEKLNEKLGVRKQEGQSTEDAVKDELKNKLLRKLFD